MGLSQFITNFFELGKQHSVRVDTRFREFHDIWEGHTWDKAKKHVSIGTTLKQMPIRKFKKGELDKQYKLLNISDQSQKTGDIEKLELVEEIGSDKNILWDADIIVSKLGLPKGYIFLNTYKNEQLLIGSTELLPYKITSNMYLPLILKYILIHENLLRTYSMLESGKTPSHKRVNPVDFLNIRIPVIDIKKQEKVEPKIEKAELEIEQLKDTQEEKIKIINGVFSKEFKYGEEVWKNYGVGMSIGTQKSNDKTFELIPMSFNNIARSPILRTTSRFHRPIVQELTNVLNTVGTIKLKDILIEDVHRGVQPKYDLDGDYYAIKTAHLKNEGIDLTDCETVSSEFFKKKERAQVTNGDILIASTGKGSIGKIDIFQEEEDAVVDGHVSIVRVNENKYNKLFLVFFLRSILGTFQIERDFTGATNQVELYADAIMNFDIPDLSIAEQDRIVKIIITKLKEQDKTKQTIAAKRKEIFKMIDSIIV
ncbi:restriction endonuclease subunit S [Oceanobacillus halophilus]|uniref:Restriction endonuclease subunit S n=1 Tax=Oceanobacillus halophilus TaxID=930130 RepID=A0A495A2N3_9BACI|nr:restriction endonuclease subunit S [Oceanobacillus halophilus]RKQ32303.1 restriction endonuclease subunit S [Oceanobacillus halophilus]